MKRRVLIARTGCQTPQLCCDSHVSSLRLKKPLSSAAIGFFIIVICMGIFLVSCVSALEDERFSLEIKDYKINENGVSVRYLLNETMGNDHVVNMGYQLFDVDGLKLNEWREKVYLFRGDSQMREVNVSFSRGEFGEFEIEVYASDGISERTERKSIFLPVGRSVTGFVSKDLGVRGNIWIGITCVIIAAAMVVVMIGRFRKKEDLGNSAKRRLIKLEI